MKSESVECADDTESGTLFYTKPRTSDGKGLTGRTGVRCIKNMGLISLSRVVGSRDLARKTRRMALVNNYETGILFLKVPQAVRNAGLRPEARERERERRRARDERHESMLGAPSHVTAVNVRRTYSRHCSRRTGTRPRPCVWMTKASGMSNSGGSREYPRAGDRQWLAPSGTIVTPPRAARRAVSRRVSRRQALPCLIATAS